ncbi:hypothetical protein [Streptomyces sp. NPDC007205]|uniref:hypothetical protein n=1 Tax=Streptomyces sp. NPDC007205 TaxID=3154316 RepID=UPI0033DF8A40
MFSVEMEKPADNPSHSAIPDLRVVTSVPADFGFRTEDVDEWVVNGGEGAVPGTVGTRDREVASDVVVRRELRSDRVDALSVSGDLMAYLALGKVHKSIVTLLSEVFDDELDGESEPERALRFRHSVGGSGSPAEPSMPVLHRFFDAARTRLSGSGHSDGDVLARFNLCFAGGRALNTKWSLG